MLKKIVRQMALIFTAIVLYPILGGAQVDRFSNKYDEDRITNYRDIILSSPNRKYLTSIHQLILQNVNERIYAISLFEGNAQGEYYRRIEPGTSLVRVEPSFGIGLDDGSSIIIDEYIKGADKEVVLSYSKRGLRTIASMMEILPREEIKRRTEKHGFGVRWLAGAEVHGSTLQLKLCNEDGSPANPERVVTFDIEKTRPYVEYEQSPPTGN